MPFNYEIDLRELKSSDLFSNLNLQSKNSYIAEEGSFKLSGFIQNFPIFSTYMFRNLSLFQDGIVITDHFFKFSSKVIFYSHILLEKPSNVSMKIPIIYFVFVSIFNFQYCLSKINVISLFDSIVLMIFFENDFTKFPFY